ncbi:MAG: PAS domain S-box protein [Hydrogenophilaceae bacterium]|nr:PAS domain S-box protein [Hydrogenophilaceae bacterium]
MNDSVGLRLGKGYWLNIGLLVLIFILLAGALAWTSQARIDEFEQRAQRSAELSAQGAAKEIAAELHGLGRALSLFAAKEEAALARFARDPENQGYYDDLVRRVHAVFPDAFAVTLADHSGQPLRTDFEGLVGEVCQADLIQFAKAPASRELYIHPHAEAYHFDMMVPISQPGIANAVFFVSFRPDAIARVLKNSQVYGHRLMMLRRDMPGLIEVDPRGSRDRIKQDFRLTAEELRQIRASVPIPGSRWDVVDLPDAALTADYVRQVWLHTALLVVALAIVTGFVLRYMVRSVHRQQAYTERLEETSAQLRDHAIRIQTIFDTVVDGIITINEEGIIETFNSAAERIFEYEAHEVIGRNISMLMPEPHRSGHDGYLRHYLATGERKLIGRNRELEGCRKDGSIFPLDLAVNEMHLDGHRLFTGIVRDISERKQLERIKNEFLSTVSHELRTPITSIRGSLGLLAGGAMGDLAPEVKQLLSISLSNSERLINLINDILDLNKIESGRMNYAIKRVELLPLLEQAMEANRYYATQYEVGFELVNALPGVWLMADPDRLMQVLANLMSNAVKFSPRRGVVTLAMDRPKPGHVRVSVRDQGPGIPEGFRANIFHKFAQADASDSRQKGGTGLGLNISKAIIEHFGGAIGYDSPPGEGATFWFELPTDETSAIAES